MSFIRFPVHQSRRQDRFDEKGVNGMTLYDALGRGPSLRGLLALLLWGSMDRGFLVSYLVSDVLVQTCFP